MNACDSKQLVPQSAGLNQEALSHLITLVCLSNMSHPLYTTQWMWPLCGVKKAITHSTLCVMAFFKKYINEVSS